MDTNPTHRIGHAVEIPPAALKACTKCKQKLAITEFHCDKNCRLGLHPSCKVCVLAYCKAKSPTKKAALAAIKRQYRRDHLYKVRLQRLVSWHRSRAPKSKAHFTAKQWLNLLKKYGHRCVCGGRSEAEVPGMALTVDHVRALSKGGSNSIRNIQPLCRTCNARKRQRFIDYRRSFQLTGSVQQVAPAPVQVESLPLAA